MDCEVLPGEFREHLQVNTDHGAVTLGSVLDDWQRADFEALDQSWLRVAGVGSGGFEGAWLERPRGHSKTSDLAVMVAWVLGFSPYRVSGVAAAADKDQARLLRDAIALLCQLNPWLAERLEVQAYKVVGRPTGSALEIISADVGSSYGITPDFVIADEITHWPRRDLWDSLVSSAAKRAGSLLLTITNAGFRDSWQWQTREQVRGFSDWHFNSLDGPQASWITPARLAKQENLLPPAAFRRYWLNQWCDGAGDALDPGDVTAAIRSDLAELEKPEDGFIYLAGVDLGLTRDASALVVLGLHVGRWEVRKPDEKPARDPLTAALIDAGELEPAESDATEIWHPATGRMRLVSVRIWKPPAGGKVSLEAVEAGIIALHERFKLAAIGLDPYQAAQMIERLSARGLLARAVNQMPANLQSQATGVLAAFRERRIDLYQHPDLVADLKSLRIVEKQYGFRLESPRRASDETGTRHADSATAFSIAVHLASLRSNTRSITVEGDLIVA